jgi:hypothetical protein
VIRSVSRALRKSSDQRRQAFLKTNSRILEDRRYRARVFPRKRFGTGFAYLRFVRVASAREEKRGATAMESSNSLRANGPGENGAKRSRAESAASSPRVPRVSAASPRFAEASHNDSLRRFLAEAARIAPSWSRRRRIRALQELLLDVSDIALHVVRELETIRSENRLSTWARS